MRSGEPDARRLLELARREVLEEVLPQVEGEARYRLRLVANAMKIAQRELAAGAQAAEAEAVGLADFARRRGLASGQAGREDTPETVLVAALRSGELDGDAELYGLLSEITRNRLDQLG